MEHLELQGLQVAPELAEPAGLEPLESAGQVVQPACLGLLVLAEPPGRLEQLESAVPLV